MSGKNNLEHEVEFARIGDRDAFRSNAVKLAPVRRAARIRMTLPDFMMSSFKLLENEGYRIVQRRPGTRRNIKFNDLDSLLVMDIKLPDSNWVRVTPEQVARVSRSRRSETSTTVDDVLAIGSLDLPPPEVVDEVDAEMPQDAGPSGN